MSCRKNGIADVDKMRYAATRFYGSESRRWLLVVQGKQVTVFGSAFIRVLRNEFLPFDSERIARDRINDLRHVICVEDYITKIRNIV